MKIAYGILLLLLPTSVGVDYRDVKLRRVYDGDTIVVDLPCEDSLFCKAISVRIAGIDTPELRARCQKEKTQAIAAREFLKKLLQGKKLCLIDCQRGKYFRIGCEVYADEENVAQRLLAEGLAKPYTGKSKRQDWCGP